LALAKSYDEAKQAYESFMASMDKYKDARENIDSLTKGTQEYTDALKEANRAGIELIKNNPELFKSG
jgi:hypothetical protein